MAGTPVYFGPGKMCKDGTISDLPNCNGSVDAVVDTNNPTITSPNTDKQCDCGGTILKVTADKCYTDPKGNSQSISDCNTTGVVLEEACLCGTDSEVAL